MRIFDSQSSKGLFYNSYAIKAPVKLRAGESVYAALDSTALSKVRVVGRKVSGNGAFAVVVKDKSGNIILEKTFQFTKKSSSEFTINCNIRSEGLSLYVERSAQSVGSVFIERIMAEGIRTSSKNRSLSKIKRDPVDYPGLTEKLLKRVRLAIIIPYSVYGGAEVYIGNIIKDGHKDFTIDALFVSNNKLIDELKGSSVNIVRAGSISGLTSRLSLKRYDYILFYNSRKIYQFLKQKKQRGELFSDLIEIYHSDFIWSDAVAKLRSRECVSKLFRVSHGLAEDITGLNDDQKLCVPVGVDPDRFSGEIPCPNDIPSGFKKTIGLVARLSPEKNISYAISVMKNIPEYQLVVVGEGPLKSKLKHEISNQGVKNITLVGYKKNVEAYYNAFDALLLTSKIEGTPISIIESLMCGKPVFTTPVGQIEGDYSGLNGVTMLTGDEQLDTKTIRSFKYDEVDASELVSFAKKRHDIDVVRDIFFSSIVNSTISSESLKEGVFLLKGEYV